MKRWIAALGVVGCAGSGVVDDADSDDTVDTDVVDTEVADTDTPDTKPYETFVVDTDTDAVDTDAVDTDTDGIDTDPRDTDVVDTDRVDTDTDTDTDPADTDTRLDLVCGAGPFPLPDTAAVLSPVAGVPGGAWGSGFGIVEGPVWFDGRLYVSVFGSGRTPASTILAVDAAGVVTTAVAGSGSNGLALHAGRLVAATHDDGAVSTFDLSGVPAVRRTLADGYTPPGGSHARFNAPNDVTVRADGNVYLTDPDAWQAPSPAPQAATRVYRIDPAGGVSVVDGSLGQPNGIALSRDQAWLFVSGPGLYAWPLDASGAVAGPRVDLPSAGIGGADGMGMDCAGRLYVTMSSQIAVVEVDTSGPTPVASRVGTLSMPGGAQATNVAFGGVDGRRFFVTALGSPPALYEGDLGVAGLPW